MLNRVELAGTLVKDPDTRDLKSGALCSEFTLAVKSVRYDRAAGCDVIDSVFIRCQAWETTAEVVAALHQGCVVMVIGQLTQQEVEGPDGRKERKTKVRALTVAPIRIPTTEAPAVLDSEGGGF